MEEVQETTKDPETSEKWKENLSEQEQEVWKHQFEVNRQTDTEDTESNDETAIGAIRYYTDRREMAKKLRKLLQERVSKEKCDKAETILERMVYPRQENALSKLKDALKELKLVVPLAAPVATQEGSEFEIDAQMDQSQQTAQLQKNLAAKEAQMAALDAQMAAKDAQMAAQMAVTNRIGDVSEMATEVLFATKDADTTLAQMELLTQAENSIMADTTDARDRSNREKKFQEKAKIQYSDEDEKKFAANPLDGPAEVYKEAKLMDADSPFSKARLAALWKNELDSKTKDRIQHIDNTFNNFIKKSKILDRPGMDATKNKPEGKRSRPTRTRAQSRKRAKPSNGGTAGTASTILPDSDDITETSTHRVDPGEYALLIENSVQTLKESFRDQHEQAGKSESSFPGPRGHEVVGSQPMFACLLEAIGSVAEKCYLVKFSAQQEVETMVPSLTQDSGASVGIKNTALSQPSTQASDSEAKQPMATAASPKDETKEVPGEGLPMSKHSTPTSAAATSSAATASTKLSTTCAKSAAQACASLGDTQHKTTPSPPKNQLGRESAVLGDSGRYRYGDFVVSKSGKHIWVYRADTLPLVFEIKAFYRSDKSWEELIANAVQQVFNHTSRYLRVSLNFAGAGLDSHATGVIGSLAYIQIYVLKLKNVGTAEVKVECVKSDLLPLMSKGNFTRWIGSNHRDGEESKWSKAIATLYPDNEEEDNVPFGLLAMLQLMMSSKSKLFGQTLENDDDLHLLSSGTFGNVFFKNNGTVVKVSRHGQASYLRSEGLAYKAVGHHGLEQIGKERCQYLAVAEEKYESIKIGTSPIKMASLIVKPAGTPLLRVGSLAKQVNHLCDVVFDVALALQHMHKYGVAHNDISIANVIVVKQPPCGRLQAKLVDLSLASPFTVGIPVFIGNPTYVHRDVHADQLWYPRPFHDLAALGFLAAVLASGSIVPWEGLSTPGKKDSERERKLEDRFQKAKSELEANLKDHKCKSQIDEWIDLDKKETILRTPCVCKKRYSVCKCAKLGLQCLPACRCAGNCPLSSQPVVAMGNEIYERKFKQHDKEEE